MKENIAEKKMPQFPREKGLLGIIKRALKKWGRLKWSRKLMFRNHRWQGIKIRFVRHLERIKERKHNKVLPTVPYL